MRRIFYLDEKKLNVFNAGSKAPNDISEICSKAGFTRIEIPPISNNHGRIYQKIWLIIVCLRNWLKLERILSENDIVICQHPIYGARINVRMIPRLQKKIRCHFICIIHDLNILRLSDSYNEKTVDILDNKLLRQYDCLICHNRFMREYLIEQGFREEKMVSLEIFDYVCEKVERNEKKGIIPSIAIAGNLAIDKCAYIYNIFGNNKDRNIGLRVHLFGNNFDQQKAYKNMIYHGSFPPDELPEHLVGDFGLIWDGISAEDCIGHTGKYLMYNNPHKTSLYIASGMPVIVWSKAAIAEFVLKNNVGIVVDSLYDLEEKITSVTEYEYHSMCKNVEYVGKRIRSGYYFLHAVEECIKMIKDD